MTRSSFSLTPLPALTAVALVSACGGGSDTPAAWSTDGNVKLQFAAVAGDTLISCDSQLKLGPKARAVRMQDMRFYVSNVALIKEDGTRVPLKLKASDDYNFTSADGKNSVSLIDLEQAGKGACEGTPPLNPTIEGTVPAGNYTGAELTVGVPLALNHLNAADAATPRVLQTSVHPAMSWNWRGGRKFTSIEFAQDRAVDATPWDNVAAGKPGYMLLHLGSTGCLAQQDGTAPTNPAVSASNPITGCKAPNRLPLSFADFNPAKQAIALDVGALFNYDFSAKGEGNCMSGPTHAACLKPFEALGLGWKADGSGSGAPLAGKSQTVFKLVNK